MVTLLLGLVTLGGLILAAVATAAEMALSAANRVRLRDLAEGSVSESAVADLVEDPLWAGIGLPSLQAVGLVLATGSAVVLVERLARPTGLAEPLLLVAYAALVVVGCLLLPIAWAARDPEAVIIRLARPLAGLSPLVRPVLVTFGLLGRLTGVQLPEAVRGYREDELRVLVHVDEENGRIEEEEMEMIAGIIELGHTKVREVMVPRIDIVAISIDARLDDALETILSAGHSRIPVYRESIDNIAGVLYAKDLLGALRDPEQEPELSSLLREAYFVPESKPVDELLAELQQGRAHMAVVVDEYGGTAGLVTIEDLLEEIVGEIRDEYDAEEPRIQEVSQDEVLFDAGVDIDDANRLMDIHLPTDEVDTLAGLVFTSLGKVPDVGERAVFEDAEIEVLSLVGRRIRRVRVVRRCSEDGAGGVTADAVATGNSR